MCRIHVFLCAYTKPKHLKSNNENCFNKLQFGFPLYSASKDSTNDNDYNVLCIYEIRFRFRSMCDKNFTFLYFIPILLCLYFGKLYISEYKEKLISFLPKSLIKYMLV